jgi:hypothetical protein
MVRGPPTGGWRAAAIIEGRTIEGEQGGHVSSIQITATFHGGLGALTGEATVSQAIIAGWTGRDPVAVEKHIRELEALGVKRPATTPIYYRVSASRITTAETIEAAGTQSSGEVEYVLFQANGTLWVGVGSDHTDREVETYGVTVSKQMCDKPVAREFWAFDAVAPHWDKLVLRSYIRRGGRHAGAARPDRALHGKEGAAGGLADVLRNVCGQGRHTAVGPVRVRARGPRPRPQDCIGVFHHEPADRGVSLMIELQPNGRARRSAAVESLGSGPLRSTGTADSM